MSGSSFPGNQDADDVASTSGDNSKASRKRNRRGVFANSANKRRNNPVRSSFGRRRSDLDVDSIATKKLVVITTVLVNALYLAGDALMFGHNLCR